MLYFIHTGKYLNMFDIYFIHHWNQFIYKKILSSHSYIHYDIWLIQYIISTYTHTYVNKILTLYFFINLFFQNITHPRNMSRVVDGQPFIPLLNTSEIFNSEIECLRIGIVVLRHNGCFSIIILVFCNDLLFILLLF